MCPRLSFLAFTSILLLTICCESPSSEPDMDQLVAWCIVPFDSLERTPEQRIQMLQDLGFKKYAYDWRQKHLPEMADEWMLAQEQGIEVSAVWMWLDGNQDSTGSLSSANEQVLASLASTGIDTRLWVSFHPNFFADLDQEEAVAKGAAMIGYLCQRTKALDLGIGLYNHGDWFGDPANQIEIIQALPDCELGLVYNFHHAHDQLDRYEELVDLMLPHLWTVNLNGMRAEGPKILPIGEGDREKEMLDILQNKGYTGPFGILGHVEDADVAKILDANLKGFAGL